MTKKKKPIKYNLSKYWAGKLVYYKPLEGFYEVVYVVPDSDYLFLDVSIRSSNPIYRRTTHIMAHRDQINFRKKPKLKGE